MVCVNAGGLCQSLLHCLREAVSRVRSHISPGPYRSFRELSLAGSVDPVIWCPPTFVGNSGIECFNGDRGFALSSCYCLSDYFLPCQLRSVTARSEAMQSIIAERGAANIACPQSHPRVISAKLRSMRAMRSRRRRALRPGEKLATRGLPFEFATGAVVSGYSPIRSELDPAPLMRKLAAQGAKLALPAVIARGKSLVFRAWSPNDRLTHRPARHPRTVAGGGRTHS